MAIDRKRLQEYQQRMRELEKTVGFAEHQKIIQARVEFLIRHNPEISQRQLKREIGQIFGPEFSKFVESSFKNYNNTLDVINEVYADLGIDIQRNFTKLKNIEEINRSYLGKFSDEAQKSIVKAVRKGLNDGLPAKELSKNLQKLGGDVSGYADTIARTQVKGYARLAKTEKSRIAGIEYFDYVGSLIQNSRPFCIDLLEKSKGGKRWTVEEIKMMNNGQRGRENVLIYCGGWNCHHDFEPDSSYQL